MQRLNGFLALVIGVAASIFAFVWLRRPAEPPPPEPPRPPFMLPVTLAPVTLGRLEPTAELIGTVRSARRVRLAFDSGGWITTTAARDGDRVIAGAELARLDDQDERLALARAEADLALAESELAKAEAGERTEVIERLRADVRTARAEVDIAELDVERGAELLATRVVSAATQDANVAARDAAAGRLAAAEQALAAAVAGTREEDLAIARARVDLARAGVAEARREMELTRIVAPWDGVVVERLLAEGDFATAGTPVFDLIDLDHLEVRLEVPERLGRSLAPGAPVTLAVDAGEPLAATIDVAIPVADEQSRNYRAIVRLERGSPGFERLRPGQFVRATVALEPLENALIVAQDAIRLVDGGEVLVIAEPIPGAAPPSGPPTGPPSPWLQAAWIPVRRLGTEDGRSAVVSLGPPLADGMQAVVIGVDRAFPGVALMPSGDGPPASPSGGGPPASPSGDGPVDDQSAADGAEAAGASRP